MSQQKSAMMYDMMEDEVGNDDDDEMFEEFESESAPSRNKKMKSKAQSTL